MSCRKILRTKMKELKVTARKNQIRLPLQRKKIWTRKSAWPRRIGCSFGFRRGGSGAVCCLYSCCISGGSVCSSRKYLRSESSLKWGLILSNRIFFCASLWRTVICAALDPYFTAYPFFCNSATNPAKLSAAVIAISTSVFTMPRSVGVPSFSCFHSP